MAIKKCKECGNEVSTKADTCPSCGAPGQKKMGCCAGSVMIIAIAFFGLLWLGSTSLPETSTTNSVHLASTTKGADIKVKSTAAKALPERTTVKTEDTPRENWQYFHSEHEMGLGEIHEARTISLNTLNLRPPYSGSQSGYLSLRTHPKFGKDLILKIEKGQILTRQGVSVRFDDGNVESYKVSGAANHQSNIAFFTDYHGFVGKMLKAKRVRIQVPIFQEAGKYLDFEVSNFSTSDYLRE